MPDVPRELSLEGNLVDELSVLVFIDSASSRAYSHAGPREPARWGETAPSLRLVRSMSLFTSRPFFAPKKCVAAELQRAPTAERGSPIWYRIEAVAWPAEVVVQHRSLPERGELR